MKRYRSIFLCLGLFCFLTVLPCAAQTATPSPEPSAAARTEKEQDGLFSTLKKRVGQTWNSREYDIYLPVNIWHNRLMYDDDKARSYNETPWGFGFGRSVSDEDRDTHSLFIMGFQDSHDRFQPYGGYAFMKNWYAGEQKDLAAGLGFVLGITARDEYGYIPLPLPLPIFGVQYQRFSVQSAYIPGGYNDGNVLFTWLRWHIE